ncbi:MAG: hypothetical protein J7K51_09475, partial [Thermotogae bacterium]|nr:hypothetical protein [Thermotogota bacterium]
KENRGWKSYFSSLKYEYTIRDYEKSLEEIKKGLRRCRSKTLYYLLLSRKLSILNQLGKSEGKKLYEQIRSGLPKIPVFVRSIIVPILLNYCSLNLYDTYRCLGKFRSELYQLDKLTATFISLSKARYEIKQGNIATGIANYIECLKMAESIPQPSAILFCLNDIAWYLKKRHPSISQRLANRAAYWAGYYYEGAVIFYVLDTLFWVQLTTNNAGILKTADIVLQLSKELPLGKGYGTYQHYKSTIEESKSLTVNLNVSSYNNTKDLRDYLKKNIKSITLATALTGIARDNLGNLLNGKVKTVYGKTLKKLTTGLNLKVDLIRGQMPLVTEWLKDQIEEDFEASIEKLKDFSSGVRKTILISTYASELDRKGSLENLARKGNLKRAVGLCTNDLNEFSNVMKRRWETKKFVINMVKAHPYIEGRKALASYFLKELPLKKREKFIATYTDSPEDVRVVVDRFVRNYARYDRRWGVRVRVSDENMKRYAKELKVKQTPVALAWYAIEKNSEKREIMDFLHRVNPL